jgi:hypothetical protein
MGVKYVVCGQEPVHCHLATWPTHRRRSLLVDMSDDSNRVLVHFAPLILKPCMTPTDPAYRFP